MLILRKVNSHTTLIGLAALAILLFIALVIAAYFILTDNSTQLANNSTLLAEYTLPVFLALPLIIWNNKRTIYYLSITAVAVISINFMLVEVPYKVIPRDLASALIGIVYTFFKLQQFGILGYYLLISVIVSLFLRASYKDNKTLFERISKRMIHGINKWKGTVVTLFVIIEIVFLVLPIYPIGMVLDMSKLPYVPINIDIVHTNTVVTASTQLYYLSNINSSQYGGLINPFFGNVWFYQNSTAIQAYLITNKNYSDYQGSLALALSGDVKNGTTIDMYILPYNTTFSRGANPLDTVEPVNTTANFSVGGYLKARPGRLINAFNYTSAVVGVGQLGWGNATQNMYLAFAPLYSSLSICQPGASVKTTVSINATANISVYGMYNESDFLRAERTNGTTNVNYQYYAKRFLEYGYASRINVTNATIPISYQDHSQCSYLILLSNNEAKLHIITSSKYYGNVYYSKELLEPEAFIRQSTYKSYVHGARGFLPSYLMYLWHLYQYGPDSRPTGLAMRQTS